MVLRDSLRSDVESIFLNLEDFAEEIRYVFRDGGHKTIKAIVERNPVSYVDGYGNFVLPSYMVTIHNNCETGILAEKIDTGGDSVELVEEFDGPKNHRVTVLSVLSRDYGGAIRLALK